MLDMTRERLYHEAVAMLILKSPAFAQFTDFLASVPLEPLDEGVAATDGVKFYIGPEFASYSAYERAFIIAHELSHIILRHPWRIGDKDPMLWNIAGDYVINDALHLNELQEISLPGKPVTLKEYLNSPKTSNTGEKIILYDPSLKDLDADSIYRMIENVIGKSDKSGKSMQQDQSGEQSKQQGEQSKQQGGWGKQQGKGKKSSEKAGSGSINGGDVMRNTNPESENETIDKLRESVHRHRERSEGHNYGEGGKMLLEALDMSETISWYSIIQKYINDIAMSNYTWSPPKMLVYPDQREDVTWVPRLRNSSIKIAVAIDTSLSIGKHDVAVFLGNLYTILRAVLSDIDYKMLLMLTTDTIYWKAVMPPYVPPEVVIQNLRDGGTDFRPAFKMVDDVFSQPPDLFIYFTDGDGDFPEQPPKYPVIWVLTKEHKVPFGISVRFSL